MRRLLAGLTAVAAVAALAFPATASAAVGDPIPLPGTPATQQVLAGEGLSGFARRLCASDFNDFYHAVQAMNPVYRLGLQGGQPLWVPGCPVIFSSSAPTTTVPPSTTTTSPPVTSTVPPSTTTSSTTTPTTSTPSSTTTSTTVTAGCSGAPGTPGSPDGRGGCFPGPGRAGIPAGTALTPYTGPCTILVANTVIDRKDLTGCPRGLSIVANNVTISRSRIYNSVHGQQNNSAAFTIVDSVIDGALPAFNGVACVDCGVDGWNFTVLRTEIVHTNRGAYCNNHCTIQDSWIHGTNLDTSRCPQASSNGGCPHASGLRIEQYANIVHNTIGCDFTGPFNADLGCSADITGYPDNVPIHHNTVDGNLLRANTVGNGFCIYGGWNVGKPHNLDAMNATFQVFTNNVFERAATIDPATNRPQFNNKGQPDCGRFGPVTSFIVGRTGNVWSGNVWSTGGAIAASA